MAANRDLELFGVFREEVGIGVSSPYQEPSSGLQRHRGKQFGVPKSTSGKLQTAFIDKKLQIYSPEPYLDVSKVEKLIGRGTDGKSVSGKPFFPAGHQAKSNGAGSIAGCVGSVALDTTPLPRPKTAAIEGRRKIYASSPKLGGPGYPVQYRTLSGHVLPYMPDEYARGRILEKAMKQAAKAKIVKPFCSVGSHDRLFTPASQLYLQPRIPGPNGDQGRRPSSAPVWRPSSPSKKGAAYCPLSKVGRDYAPDPVPEAEYKARTKAARAPFRPGSGICKQRLSMWTPNPFERAARPAPDIDFTLY